MKEDAKHSESTHGCNLSEFRQLLSELRAIKQELEVEVYWLVELVEDLRKMKK